MMSSTMSAGGRGTGVACVSRTRPRELGEQRGSDVPVERNMSGETSPQKVPMSALSHSTDSGNGGEYFSPRCRWSSQRTFSVSFSTPRAAFQA